MIVEINMMKFSTCSNACIDTDSNEKADYKGKDEKHNDCCSSSTCVFIEVVTLNSVINANSTLAACAHSEILARCVT